MTGLGGGLGQRGAAALIGVLLAAAPALAMPEGLSRDLDSDVREAWRAGYKLEVAETLSARLRDHPNELEVRLLRGQAYLDALDADSAIADFRLVYDRSTGNLKRQAAQLVLEAMLLQRRLEQARDFVRGMGATQMAESLTQQIAQRQKLSDQLRFSRRALVAAAAGWVILIFGASALISRIAPRPPDRA